MKRLLSVLTAMTFILASVTANPGPDATTYTIDPLNSEIQWEGTKVTGSHNGTIKIADGSVMVSGKSISATDVTIDMNTIACLDIENETYNQKLVGHLKSDDFFSVASNPEAMFEASKFTAIEGAKAGEANYTVTGKLTIKGITNEISFPAVVSMDGNQFTAKGTADIDRTKFNIQYSSGSFFQNLGDKMIHDNFEITFDIVATNTTIN